MKLALLLMFLIVLAPLVTAGVKENIESKLNEIEKKFDLAKYSLFLPITIKISVLDKDETFFVKINKNGKFDILDDAKANIVIQGNEEFLKKVLNSDDKDFENDVSKINVYGTSLKGEISIIVAEKISSTHFSKKIPAK
ncbi:MAG: hypothetical protein WD876_00680 [Candidatus Pacearchaeota archaeon]